MELADSQLFRMERANLILNFCSSQNLLMLFGNDTKLSFKRCVTTNKLRLLFANNGAGIVIRSTKRYDQISENQTSGIESRIPILRMTLVRTTFAESGAKSEEFNQSQCSIPDIVIVWS